jgi:hypothetical protein
VRQACSGVLARSFTAEAEKWRSAFLAAALSLSETGPDEYQPPRALGPSLARGNPSLPILSGLQDPKGL